MNYLANEALEALRTLRHDIHAHPEAAFEEERTAAIVANFLRACGVDEVHEKIGTHGVVGILAGKKPGKTIALRSDIDALPMQEIPPAGTERKHCSIKEGRFHGCGHDGHTVMLLGAAQYLASRRDFAGKLVFIFQPAEETLSGAQAMLADGLFTRFPFDEIYGLHNVANMPFGEVHINEGPTFSASDNFSINIHGKGSHGAMPQHSSDPIVIAARLIMDFQTIVSRNTPPMQPIALSFGEIHGGSSFNIIPDSLRLSGTLRTYDEAVRSLAKERMLTLINSISAGFQCRISIDYATSAPAVTNDTGLAHDLVEDLQKRTGGDKIKLVATPQTPSEDFAYYLAHAKGVFALIGQGYNAATQHHPEYDFNDDLIPLGIAYWIAVVQARLPL